MLSNSNAIEILTSHNIRPSVQRVAVLSYLMRFRVHPTVDEIYSSLSELMPTLSKTTVYNVLGSLVEKGVVQALTIDDKNVRYDADTSDHAHFKCGCCGGVYDVPAPEMSKELAGGYMVTGVHVYYHGVCPKCLNKNKKRQ